MIEIKNEEFGGVANLNTKKLPFIIEKHINDI
jgi:hypothetical protein